MILRFFAHPALYKQQQVLLSLAKILLQVSRPHTAVLGNIPGTSLYRNVEQYPHSVKKPGVLVIRIDIIDNLTEL